MYRTKAEALAEAREWGKELAMVPVQVFADGTWEAEMYGAWAVEPQRIVDRRGCQRHGRRLRICQRVRHQWHID